VLAQPARKRIARKRRQLTAELALDDRVDLRVDYELHRGKATGSALGSRSRIVVDAD
jgi:hypothetical protein